MNKSESKYFNTAVKFNQTLLALLERKPFEYITIKEICQEAKVNRSTFYLHYENMNDLLYETIEFFIEQFNSNFDIDVEAFVHDLNQCDIENLNFITEQYLIPFLSFMKDHHKIVNTALSQMTSIKLDLFYKRFSSAIFYPILERFAYPIEHREYAMKFYLNGIAAILKEWFRKDCSESIEEMCEIIQNCILGRDNRCLGLMNQFTEQTNHD